MQLLKHLKLQKTWILSIELFNAAQALDFRRPLKTSEFLEKFVGDYREKVSFIDNDRVMYDDISKTVEFLREVEYELEQMEQWNNTEELKRLIYVNSYNRE